MKETIGIKVTFTLEIKLQQFTFWQNMTTFLVTDESFFNPSKDRNLHTSATTKQLKKNAFTINSRSIN